jgi:type I restriction enzyme S subunit
LLRVDLAKVLPAYVFWRLRYDWVSGLPRSYSRRTTGITNLSVKDYIAREILVPTADDQARLIESAAAVETLILGLRAEAAHLRSVRYALLSGLLDRTIEVKPAELEV